MFEYRGSNPAVKTDERTEAPIYRYRKVSEIPWITFAQQPNRAVRIIVQRDSEVLPLDILYIPRDHERLLVGLHGAEFKNKDLPKFQFVRSFQMARKESLLFLSDSTHLYKLGEIGLCWYAGDARSNISILYADLINSLNEATGIKETILAGHSGGGAAAVKIGTRVPNSRAVAINAQFSAQLYHRWTSENLRKYVYDQETSVETMWANYPERFSLALSLKSRLPSSTISWFSHIDDGASFSNFKAIQNHNELSEYGGNTEAGDCVIACNWEAPPDAHALPGSIIPFIQVTLGEPCSFDLKPLTDVDFEWHR